jgi:hypothetical protein
MNYQTNLLHVQGCSRVSSESRARSCMSIVMAAEGGTRVSKMQCRSHLEDGQPTCLMSSQCGILLQGCERAFEPLLHTVTLHLIVMEVIELGLATNG